MIPIVAAAEIMDWVIEEAKLPGLLPLSRAYVSRDKRSRFRRNASISISTVPARNFLRSFGCCKPQYCATAVSEIDVVDAGGGYRDELQFRQSREFRRPQRQFVADCDRGR